MISKLNHFIKISLSGAVILTMGVIASGQPFQYQDGDLIMTFRKNGAFQENYELVVDIGSATNYVTLAIGTTITVPNVSPTQVVPDSFNTYSNLSWAVVGGVGPQVVFPSYPGYTVWVTVPRARVGVKSKDAPRDYYSLQGATRNTIVSLLLNADYISSNLGFSNEVNNIYLVREPWADANFN